MRIVYIPQESPDGLAHAVKISRDYLNDEPFVMYLGDNLLKDGIRSFVEEFGKGGADAQILLAQVDNPGDFGVAELDGGRVVALEEKPKRPKSNYALVGVYLFNHHVFEAVDNIKPSQRNELEITDAIQYLIDHKRVVKSHVVDGWWKDTGKLDDILEANHMFLQDIEPSRESEPDNVSKIRGRVQIGKNVTIEDSELRGPCVIGEGARIIGAYVGPFTSIGPRTEISHSEIENSIVLEDCVIKDVGSRIGNSLIGRNVTVSKNKKPPQTYQLVVGDNSQIVIL